MSTEHCGIKLNCELSYLNMYKNSFQHGGISLEEVIVPLITLKSKNEHSIQSRESIHLKDQKRFSPNYFLSKLEGQPDVLDPNNDKKCQVENIPYNTKRDNQCTCNL